MLVAAGASRTEAQSVARVLEAGVLVVVRAQCAGLLVATRALKARGDGSCGALVGDGPERPLCWCLLPARHTTLPVSLHGPQGTERVAVHPTNRRVRLGRVLARANDMPCPAALSVPQDAQHPPCKQCGQRRSPDLSRGVSAAPPPPDACLSPPSPSRSALVGGVRMARGGRGGRDPFVRCQH